MRTALLVALLFAPFALSARTKPFTCTEKPVPWESVKNKDAYTWKLYSAPRGTDLRNIKPKYHRCSVRFPTNRNEIFKTTFEHNTDFEFQTFDTESIGANCIDCLPTILGNYYSTKISNYITCDMYEDTPIN